MAFNKPAKGDRNWDVTLNATLDDLKDRADTAQAAADGKLSPAAAEATYVPSGATQVIAKLTSGQDVTLTFVGDSILEGATVTTPGTDDAASLLVADLADRFGVTVTKSNRAVSGRTVQRNWIEGAMAAAVGDQADCYVICQGKNDIRSDIATPGTGYPRSASLGGVEHLIRRIRVQVPGADILLLGANPYTPISHTSNDELAAYNGGLRRLAAHYGCVYVDGYTPFVDLGDFSAYMADSTHPNSAGHALLADALIAKFPDSAAPGVTAQAPPEATIFGAERWDSRAWAALTTSGGSRPAGTDGYRVVGAGWSSTSAPHTSSTAGDFVQATFLGSEVAVVLDCGPGNGVVDFEIDGVAYSSQDLSGGSYLTGLSRRIPFTGLGVGAHTIVVRVVSGSVTVRGFEALLGPVGWIGADSALLTKTGAWTTGANADTYSGQRTFSATLGDSITFDFVGTALGAHMFWRNSNLLVGVTVDGVALPNASLTKAGADSQWGHVTLASGLEYGRHTAVLTVVDASPTTQFGAFTFWDENRVLRPTRQAGLAKVGASPKYHCPFPAKPALRLSPADSTSAVPPYATSESTSGFTAAGTAAATVLWEAEGARTAW